MGEQYREEIREHISCFPIKTFHYSNKDYKYLDARLNVKIMYSLFKEKYPNSPVKYSYYIKFFKQNFELHFGSPQVDVCNTCEDLSLKIKNPKLNAQAKRVAVAEKIVHQRRAKKFYSTLNTTTEECQQREDLAAFCFDFMQNLQLPEFPTQDKFYLSQLTVSLFSITNLKTQKSFFYIYHEGQAAKGPNELRMFCDNCPGQNKNHSVVRMCMALKATDRFQKIVQYYPIRGHSFLPCDRAFGIINIIKTKLRRFDRVYNSLVLLIHHLPAIKSPLTNIVYEHFKFFKRDQLPNETIDQFITTLKQLPTTCEFKEKHFRSNWIRSS
ncbi:hypothetical protein RN001_001051 [Aquatica leii]|uniref:DUF7869 domain-containing protein n=1 Tax=Aquatica leii TaxID=1421715 RepID=A0AAN7QA38_9COLE|nr:hypothetical protein RN001_001051 [Aquatica leii]